MEIKYCLPVIAKTQKEATEILERYVNDYSYFELWLDYIEDLTPEFITHIADIYQKGAIFLFRRLNLDSPMMPSSKRKEYLNVIAEKNVSLDLDITSQFEDINYFNDHNQKAQLIVSYHNYALTPPDAQLNAIIAMMQDQNANIFKVAAFCRNENDALRLLQLTLTFREKQKKYIVLGMGEYGYITRIFGTLWGNEMIFAPAQVNSVTAPAQLTREKLDAIFSALMYK